jgi:putative restriction endonuclease
MREDIAKIKALSYYSTKFRRLRVDRAHGIAPHKPILILSVLHLIESDRIHRNQIYLRQELIDTFMQVWTYLGSEIHCPDISRPFFHLRGDQFWHHIPNRGFRKIVTSKIKLKTFAEVRSAIKYAYIDDSLFEMLQNPTDRKNLETILVQRWFYEKLEQYKQLQALWSS